MQSAWLLKGTPGTSQEVSEYVRNTLTVRLIYLWQNALTLTAVNVSVDCSPPRDLVISTHHWHSSTRLCRPLLHDGGPAQSCPVWGWTTTSSVTQPCVHPGCSAVGEFHYLLTQTQNGNSTWCCTCGAITIHQEFFVC